MALTMYQASVPVYARLLNGLAGCLRKAAAHYGDKKLDEASLLSYRLYPDMFNFTKQIQAATDHARNGVATPFRAWSVAACICLVKLNMSG